MDILYIDCILKQRGNVLWEEARNTTSDGGDEESLIRVRLSISDELVNIRLDRLNASLHRRYSVALSLWAITITHHGTKVKAGCACGTSTVHSGKVATEDEDLVGLELGNILRSDTIRIVWLHSIL